MPRKRLLKTAKLEGTKFPQVQATLLDGGQLLLPDAARGRVALVMVALMQQEPGVIDSWIAPFEHEFGRHPEFTYYLLALLGEDLSPQIIDEGMRDGLPPDQRGRVATNYQPRGDLVKRLAIEDGLLVYVYLLDRTGRIRWWGWGKAAEPQLAEIMAIARRQLQKR